jgi:hypothetical protein
MQPAEQQQDFYSLGEFARRHSIGLRTVYAEISAGRLTARKIGRRTVIAIDDAKTWTDQLPKVPSRTAAEPVVSERADFGHQRHEDEYRAGGDDDEAAPHPGERNRSDVLIVGDERYTTEQRRHRGTEPIGGDGSADAPLRPFDAEHPG